MGRAAMLMFAVEVGNDCPLAIGAVIDAYIALRPHPGLRTVGTDFQLLDINFYGRLPIPGWEDHELSFKIGRQTVNWGESTLLAINSINQANPVNANNLYRVGTQVEEVFTPVGMAFASIEPFTNATIEAFYQFEWEPLDAPPPGSYFATNDLGTHNAGRTVNSKWRSTL